MHFHGVLRNRTPIAAQKKLIYCNELFSATNQPLRIQIEFILLLPALGQLALLAQSTNYHHWSFNAVIQKGPIVPGKWFLSQQWLKTLSQEQHLFTANVQLFHNILRSLQLSDSKYPQLVLLWLILACGQCTRSIPTSNAKIHYC